MIKAICFVIILVCTIVKVINCARCGTEICYGDSYTSLQIHDARGIGYAICGDCLNKEVDEL